MIAPHLKEPGNQYHGNSLLLLEPATTKEVSAILAICHQSGTAITPQGGNTGLVGAQIPLNGEVLLSTRRLNRINHLDGRDQTLIAEAGVVLDDIHRAAREHGLMFPVSLAAEGSCTIGGNISTNAGGVNVLRYGMTRDSVLGLEVVLADGTILEMLRTLHKDNAGYDLKHIFIGAEGTLGIVTAAALQLYPEPTERATAFAAVPNLSGAVQLLTQMQAKTGGLLSAFEIIPRIGIEFVCKYIPGTRDPLAVASPWYVLLEATGGVGARLSTYFEDALAESLAAGFVSDAVVPASQAHAAMLWRVRESLSEAQGKAGAVVRHDVSVPISAIPDFVTRASAAVLAAVPGVRPVIFGHLGDGNLHFNLSAPEHLDGATFLTRRTDIQSLILDIVKEFSGSISAEHGIGILKRDELLRYKSVAELEVMRTLKRTFDPRNILNPGKLVLPNSFN